MTDGFIRVAKLSELGNGKGRIIRLDDDEIGLVKIGDSVSAFVNSCPHQHTPLVDQYGGQIAGDELTCPMHGWTFSLTTGKCVNVPPSRQTTNYPADTSSGVPNPDTISVMSGNGGKLKMLEVMLDEEEVFVKKSVAKLIW